MELEPHQRSEGAAGQGRMLEIGVHLIPGITHRGVHIAHMQLVRADEHPLCHQVAAAQHKGVAGQVELLDRHRQQRQVLLHVAGAPGKALNKAGGDRAAH